jgi:multidrug resistance protein, MATE family
VRRPEVLRGSGRELREVTQLAAPVVVVQLGIMLMGTIDTMMLGRYSAAALAGAALGNSVAATVMLIAWGTVLAIDPLIAQAYGARDGTAIAAHLQRGLVLAAVLPLPIALLFWDLGPLLSSLGQQPEVAEGAAAYLRGMIAGNFAFLPFVVLRQTIQAFGIVRPAVIAMVAANLANVAGNWILIYGRFGFPELGVAGSAYATSISRFVLLGVLVLAARPALAPYWQGFDRRAFAWREHLRYIRIGLPIGFHFSLELGVLAAIALLMGRMGIEQLAGHQIALNLSALSFMVPAGIGSAAASRVGNAIGRADMPGARRAAAACLLLGVGTMALFALLFAAAPGWLAGLYTNQATVIAMAAALIPIAAVFQVFDGAQVVSAGVLRGAADTRTPAIAAVIGYWIVGLPLGAWLALRAGAGPQGLWWGLTAGIGMLAVLLMARILRRFRGEIRRVEVESAPEVI